MVKKIKQLLEFLNKYPATEKAAKTFVQSFTASLIVFATSGVELNITVIYSAVVAAWSFAISQAWNSILAYYRAK